ncbi:hypothetical protein ACFXTO_025468 [Malus domestica]
MGLGLLWSYGPSAPDVVNTPQTHILVWGSEGVYFSFIKTDSPGTSPNTDGIHIQDSQHVEIHGAELKSGDDCVSIGDYCSHIYITDESCGPGHGIRLVIYFLNLFFFISVEPKIITRRHVDF